MTSAAETFVVELARSASRRSHRLLRGLSKEDADDVLSSAILFCWEHKDEHDPATQNLEEWFIDALKRARREFRNSNRTSQSTRADMDNELLALVTQDETLQRASGESTAQFLDRTLTQDQQQVLRMMDTKNWSMRKATRVVGVDVFALRTRLKRIKDEVPEMRDWYRTITRKAPDSDDLPYTEKPSIDVELGALDFPPAEGKDCPPCWRCKWFEGWAPSAYRPTKLVDPEVQAAVRSTEAEKIRIAFYVSNRGE